jgi:hypothetical protein
MATTLTEYNFAQNHGNSKYNWAELCDGRIVKLTQGQDFECEPAVFRGQVIVRARKEGKLFRTNVRGNDVIFTLQADGESPEQFAVRTAAQGLASKRPEPEQQAS